ncbi:MAG TPA: DUF3967 domain-containing protein [Bacillus sp. (in: firmicutes)]|nr:DUF3967 domain-containing protein [Bacillus sp. (in: firmicutes)]
MSADINESQSLYSSSDTATLLKIQESTLRKYCLMLEEAGYHFHKNEFGHRGFFEKDVIALKRLMQIKKHPDMTLKQACNAVMTWLKEDDITDLDTTVITDIDRHNARPDLRIDDLLNEFREYKNQRDNFERKLVEEIQRQREYIETVLAKRDEVLMSSLKEILDTRKEIAAAQKEKKKWWKFW